MSYRVALCNTSCRSTVELLHELVVSDLWLINPRSFPGLQKGPGNLDQGSALSKRLAPKLEHHAIGATPKQSKVQVRDGRVVDSGRGRHIVAMSETYRTLTARAALRMQEFPLKFQRRRTAYPCGGGIMPGSAQPLKLIKQSAIGRVCFSTTHQFSPSFRAVTRPFFWVCASASMRSWRRSQVC
jgi:hypothetical protein